MKEDLSSYGNELNYFTTYCSIGYVIMLISSQIVMTYVRPSYWLLLLKLVWGILTGLLAASQNAGQIYALRAFIGLCESTVGGMMANALETAMHTTFNRKTGLEGWKWIFIVNRLVAVTVATLGFATIPDYPNKSNP
ncbi:major facilitator superfamily transporter [Moniliophthora roreri MCA 2997]|uniref:Major facilitator superfamily transporter n=1 Tax=Moniliophthora roreri (strain MCA 2997) TaxID=1381753 RepID=V2XVZ6_MONRO|nr:major facilitator superfamily transporter [Moniliophthora roreri MCA 2997]